MQIRNISVTLGLVVLGAAFLFFSLGGIIPIGEVPIQLAGAPAKLIAAILGIVLIGLAVFLELRSRRGEYAPTDAARSCSLPAIAENFFYTLDDNPAANFPNLVSDARSIAVLGRTSVNLLNQYRHDFERLAAAGCHIRLLFVDPSSQAADLVYGGNPDVFRTNCQTASLHLQTMKKLSPKIEVRVTQHTPTLSILAIEKADSNQSFLQIQLYFIHSIIGRDRPLFLVNRNDKWYPRFLDEFNQLWDEAEEWDVTGQCDKATN